MNLTYNGIDLKVVRPVVVRREAVYDQTGNDYLWTKWTIVVQAIYNPQGYETDRTAPGLNPVGVTAGGVNAALPGSSAPAPAPNPLLPVTGRFNSPVYTDAALRHKLLQPRGTLTVTFASGVAADPQAPAAQAAGVTETWLDSPQPDDVTGARYPCDCANGPIPVSCDVQDIYGNGRTFVVQFAVTTCVRDCIPGQTSSLGQGLGSDAASLRTNDAILSNQWTATVSYDEQYLATRTVIGVAVFRADVLNGRRFHADQARFLLIPPVPQNCKRHIRELTQMGDGYTYKYAVDDVEQPLTYYDHPSGRNPRNITELDVEVSRGYTQQGGRTLIPASLNYAQQAAWAASQFKDLVPGLDGAVGDIGGRLAGKLAGKASVITKVLKFIEKGFEASFAALAASVAVANEFVGEFEEVVTVTVSGNRAASMADLQYAAFAAAFGQATSVPLAIPPEVAAVLAGGAAGAGGGLAGELAGIAGIIMGGAIPGKLAEATGAPIGLAAWLKLIPPASVYDLRWSPTRKTLQFTLKTSYAGLVDWVLGGVAGGWRAITAPIPDSVVGGDWPRSATYNYGSANLPVPVDAAGGPLPNLPDKGIVLANRTNGLSFRPPAFSSFGGPGLMGTNLTRLVEQDLLGECAKPTRFDADETRIASDIPGGGWAGPTPTVQLEP